MNSRRFLGKRVLVTGAAGFIGSHIVESLVEYGASVTVLDNFSTGHSDNLAAVADLVSLQVADIARQDICPLIQSGAFDLIVHAAGNANIPASVADPQRDLEDNILGTQRLLEAVRRVSSQTAIVNLSSATVYADGSVHPMTEDEPKQPVSPYGVSKLAAEGYLRVYVDLFGVRACSVRIFSVFGPRLRKQVVWDFMSRLYGNPSKLEIHGDGTERRNPTHVSNVVEAILVVAEKARMNGDVYNVGSRESISITELARDVAAAMGLSPTISFSGKRGAGHARTWLADVSRLEALGFRPVMSYRLGLEQTADWFASIRTSDLE